MFDSSIDHGCVGDLRGRDAKCFLVLGTRVFACHGALRGRCHHHIGERPPTATPLLLLLYNREFELPELLFVLERITFDGLSVRLKELKPSSLVLRKLLHAISPVQLGVKVSFRHFLFSLFADDTDNNPGAVLTLRLRKVSLWHNLDDFFLLDVDLIESLEIGCGQELTVIDLDEVLHLHDGVISLVRHQGMSQLDLLCVLE